MMNLTPDEAHKLAKLCKKYYKAYNRYWEYLHDPHLDECDGDWDDDAYELEEKRDKAERKLNKYLKKLEDK